MIMLATTSLYIAGQNQTTGTQVASWQQAMTAAESGVDEAVAALNNNSWTNWNKVTQSGTSLPSAENGITSLGSATVSPTTGFYNYLPSSQFSLTTTGEGAVTTSAWVTVDTAGMSPSQDTNGNQWYRIRSTGLANISGPKRATMNRLDSRLRHIALLKNRNGDSTLGASRTIEVVMKPLPTSGWSRGITMKTGIQMSGGGVIDSYDSSLIPAPHQWSLFYRKSYGDVGIVNNTTGSDLKSTYVYGSLSYSNSVIKNTTNVQGSISTPGPTTPSAAPTPPTGVTWQAYGGGGGTMTAGTDSTTPAYYKVTGDLTVPGGNSLLLQAANANANNPIVIWVTGKLTTSGSGFISQASNIYATWYVGGDITASGSSYVNNAGYPSQVTINGLGSNNKATISGSASFNGTINAPNYDFTISGGGAFQGAVIGDTITISGGSSFHFDQSLTSGPTGAQGRYSFASWFEDNSNNVRGVTY